MTFSSTTSTQNSINELELHQWLMLVFEALENSDWHPVLYTPEGINILDALIIPIYQTTRQLVTSNYNQPHVSNLGKRYTRIPTFITQRRLPNIVQRLQAHWQSTNLNTCEVLFFPREVTHLKVQLPIAEELVRRGRRVFFITAKLSLFETLYKASMPVKFVPLTQKQDYQSPHKLPDISQLPPPPFNLNTAVVLENILNILQRKASDMLAMSDLSKQLATYIPNGVAVIGNDLTPEGRVMTRYFQQTDVTTAMIMHGYINENDPIHSQHIVDNFLVFGPRTKRQLINTGLAEERLTICGAPYLDKYPKQTGQTHPQIAKQLLKNQTQEWALLALSGAGHSVAMAHHLQIIEAIYMLKQTYQVPRILAKLHRKDSVKHYHHVHAKYSDIEIPVIEHNAPNFPTSIFDWLQGCSVVITGASTVALEAMLMGVPVITIDLMNELNEIDFIAEGATLHARSQDELEAALHSVISGDEKLQLSQEKARKLLHDIFYKLDGESAARCAQKIIDLEG